MLISQGILANLQLRLFDKLHIGVDKKNLDMHHNSTKAQQAKQQKRPNNKLENLNSAAFSLLIGHGILKNL